MRTSLLMVLAATGLLAQAPSPVINPVVINNDQVRVLKVIDQPHQPSAMHQHKLNRVMIYLDAGRMTLRNAGGKTDRLAWKAGDVLWSPARGNHISENVTDKPVRIVEVELKGTPQPVEFPALDPVKVDPKHYKVAFENDQVRVVRARYGPHEKGVLHEHGLNRVVVLLTDEDMQQTLPDGATHEARGHAGDVQYAGTAKHSEVNRSSRPFEVIVVELKTR